MLRITRFTGLNILRRPDDYSVENLGRADKMPLAKYTFQLLLMWVCVCIAGFLFLFAWNLGDAVYKMHCEQREEIASLRERLGIQ